MNRIEFLINWYHKEIERRASLNASINIPIGVLSAILLLIFFSLKNFNQLEDVNTFAICIFNFTIFFSFLFWIIAVYYLCVSYNRLFKGYNYDELPYPTQLNRYYGEISTYYNNYYESFNDFVTADSIYKEQMIIILSKCLDTNLDNNAIKSKYLHISKKFIFSSLISTILCLIIYGIYYLKIYLITN